MEISQSQGIWPPVGRFFRAAAAGLGTLQRGLVKNRRERRLRLSETLSLGEKRFLAVVEFGRQEFLVGGTGSSIVLLTRLSGEPMQGGSQEARESNPF
jgi:flagellar biogenesis protein FliO